MKKILVKIIIGVLVLAAVIAGLYFYDMHSLALTINKNFEQRCVIVNPALIAYKNSFLNFAAAVKNPKAYTPKEAADFYIAYIEGMRAYAPKEAFWILVQRDLVNRWDFKLLEPEYMKEAAGYQIKMYEGYRDEAQTSVDAADGKITIDELNTLFADARKRRDDYTYLYNGVFDDKSAVNDWRNWFNLPLPTTCNESNLIIPDTTGALDATPPPIKDPDTAG